MALVFEPFAPWHLIVAGLLTVASGALLARGVVDRWRPFGRLPLTRIISLCLTLGAALFFGLAAWNPYFVKRGQPGVAHLVFLLDVSESALRVQKGFEPLRQRVSRGLSRSIKRLSAAERERASADLFTFGDGVVRVAANIPLADLPNALDRLGAGDFAAGGHSDLETALADAGDRIDRIAGGQGAVYLVSDGNQTRGDALAASVRLARRGIPVHVVPLESAGPQLAINAADLPRQVHSGARTHVRGVLRNSSSETINGELTIARNPGLADDLGDTAVELTTTRNVPFTGWSRLRQEVVFDGYGLQFLDLTLGRVNGEGRHRRRFFTHVNRPPHLLAVGGDFRWVSAFPKSAAKITQVRPEALPGQIDLRDQDAIVLSGVSAERLSQQAMDTIATAVSRDGVGLMVINGDHDGYAAEAETVLMSYRGTPLEELLPVNPGPRPEEEEPSRNIIIMIDTSGSMRGLRLRQAREIARHIIGTLMSPKDRLDLITFTRGVGHLVKDAEMTDKNRGDSLALLNTIEAGGGTDPKEALKLIASRNMSDCGLIFISDGEFGEVVYRPDCRATVFAMGKTFVPANSPLHDLADPFPVGYNFNPASIKIPYFNPEPRERFFESDIFRALKIERFVRGGEQIPMPDLPLNGNAISYIKDDTELIAVRPKLTDPVLAYRRSGLGFVGVFTGGLSDQWLSHNQGLDAVVTWITRLVSYTARDRYDFKIRDRGETLEIDISLLAKDGLVPRVERLSATVEISDKTPVGIPMRPDDLIPGTFHGAVQIPREAITRKAILILRETGPDALTRAQRIPMLIPLAGLVSTNLGGEAFSYGTNEPLLRAVAQTGGGLFDPGEGAALFRRNPVLSQGKPLWPALIVAAAFCYLFSFGVRRFDP